MVAAVFLDRDGVINRALIRDGKPYPPSSIQEFTLLDGVPEACQILKEIGYLLVVATNQPDVGRGTLPQSVVEEIHTVMCRSLPIDHVEVCYDAGGELPSVAEHEGFDELAESDVGGHEVSFVSGGLARISHQPGTSLRRSRERAAGGRRFPS